MYGNHFYNETTRRYVAVFGTMFNDIEISRKTGNTTTQQMKVPINYAPMQKILARINQDPQLNAPAITLPRMSFEMTGMTYAPDRKLTSVTKLVRASAADGDMTSMYAPAPYDIEFQLNVMTKYNEDGTKIIEQILPFFKPDCTVSVKLIDELGTYFDIPIVLNSVSQEDTYEGDFESRRALIWTLNFTMKGYFFGPVSTRKQITFVDVDVAPVSDFADGQPGNVEASQVTASPSDYIFSPFSFTEIDGETFWTHNLEPGEEYRIVSLGPMPGGPDANFQDDVNRGTNARAWERRWDTYIVGEYTIDLPGQSPTLNTDSPDSTEDVDGSVTWSVGDTFTVPDLIFKLDNHQFSQPYRDKYGPYVSNPYNANRGQWYSTQSISELKLVFEHALVQKVQVPPFGQGAIDLELGIDDDWKNRTIVENP